MRKYIKFIRKLSIAFLYFNTLLFFTCSEKKTNVLSLSNENFEVISLEGEQILSDEIFIESIFVVDNFLIVKQVPESEFHFKIFDKKSFQPIGYFGKKDKNIQTSLFLNYFGQFSKENDNLTLNFFNFLKSEFSTHGFTTNHNSYNDSLIISKKQTLKINPEKFSVNQVFKINDSILIGDSGNFDINNNRLKKINLNKNETSESEMFPEVSNIKLLPLSEIKTLYKSHIDIDKKNNKIVSALEHYDRIDIFDYNLNCNRSIISGKQHSDFDIDILDLDYKGDNPLDDLNIYYFDLVITEKYIYALYYNQIEKDYGEIKPVEIRVFDLLGNPKYRLKIPEYLINISVDEEEGYLYGSAFFEEKTMKYKLNF